MLKFELNTSKNESRKFTIIQNKLNAKLETTLSNAQ